MTIRNMLAMAAAAAAAVVATTAGSARADINVFVDFNAAWVTELGQATTDAGVAAFTATERTQLQDLIVSDLQTIYSGYQINFSTTDPGGTRDRINFGVDESAAGAGTLGFAPLQIGNFSTGDDTNILPRNFAFAIETGDARSQQLLEIGRVLGGTAAHELAHSLGIQHYQAYGNPGITPANYANTGGLQNQHIIATGPSGLSETGRETLRTFNRFERAVLDITGGTIFGGQSVVANPITTNTDSTDAGGTPGTARAVVLTAGATSGLQMALRLDELDGATTDVDVFSFTVASAGALIADVYSTNLFGASFDAQIRLIGPNGTTVLAANDDVSFNNNTFNVGTNNQELDPNLMNIQLASAGTYYLEVSASAVPDANFLPAVGDDYQLLIGFAPVPEPTGLAAVAAVGLALAARHRRRPVGRRMT